MQVFAGRRGIAIAGLLVAGCVVALVVVVVDPSPPEMRELRAIRADFDRAIQGRASEGFGVPLDSVLPRSRPGTPRLVDSSQLEEIAARCLRLSDNYPKTTGELASLMLAASRAPRTKSGKLALERLHERISTADPTHLSDAFSQARVGFSSPLSSLAPGILDVVQSHPDHVRTGSLLATVCLLTRADASLTAPSAEFTEAADLIVSRYAHDPEIFHFCECVGGINGAPAWAGGFEHHLRTILEQNGDRFVRCSASFALASLVDAEGPTRQEEALMLYQDYVDEFDGKVKYRAQPVEEAYRFKAESRIQELEALVKE